MASIRMRLFDLTGSPLASVTAQQQENWSDDLMAILTPVRKNNDDEEQTPDFSIEIPNRKPQSEKDSVFARRSLFYGKRPADHDDMVDSPTTKRLKETEAEFSACSIKEPKGSSDIINAVERLSSQQDLIGDGSRDYVLPTIPGKHSDLKSISCDVMADVVTGKYAEQLDRVTIVDCRYPYEFEGGHIRGATNMYTKDDVVTLLQTPVTPGTRHVLIFHCEFSSERGPKMYRFLRAQDRELNQNNYPRLNFPEIYLLHAGYKAFYESHKNLCDPISYMPMLHEEHTADLRHFRVKSKSWTAGEKQKTSRRCRSRLSRQSLGF